MPGCILYPPTKSSPSVKRLYYTHPKTVLPITYALFERKTDIFHQGK
jgi:hypothetical protein